MIKIKKIIFAVGIAALLCSSCKLQSQIDDLTKENEKLEKELAKTKEPDAKTATPGASSADVVTVRINKARGFATRWISNTSKSAADANLSRNALELAGDESLVKLNEDGTVEEALVLPEGLADWCNYNPVREVYQCSYVNDLADDAAKGIYIVFSWYIDWWKLADTEDEEGNIVEGAAGPEVGQLLYVKPDGSIIDVFAKKDEPGKINKIYLNTYLKENDDRDYIKFDKSGNAFMIITDQDDGEKIKIARFNPISGETTYYKMPVENMFIRNFEVKSDGSFFYINAMVGNEGENRVNNVYALPVKADATPITLFTSNCTKENWGVSNLCYNPITNQMIFFVDDWLGNDEQSGLYICKDDATNGLAIAKHLYNVPLWSLQTAFEYKYNTATDKKTEDSATYVKKAGTYTKADGTKVSDGDTNPNKDGKATYNFDAEYDYAGMLKHLKSFYGNKKVYFTLDYFKKYSGVQDNTKATKNDDYDKLLDGWFNPYTNLYATEKVFDADGNLLKETQTKAATPYEYTDKDGNVYKYDYKDSDRTTKPNADKEGKVLTEEKALKYLMEYTYMYFESIKDANGNEVKDADGNVMYAVPTITNPYKRDFAFMLGGTPKGATYANTPIWMFFTDKEDGTWNAPIYPCGDETFANAEKGSIRSGELVYTKDGFFLLNAESSDWDKYGQEWTEVVQVTDKEGNVVMSTPAALKGIKGYVTDNWSDSRKRQDSDPWYKAPFKSTQAGFTLRSEDGKSMYYYNGTDCKTIVDGKKLNLATVYSFTLSDTALIYNAYSMNGGSRTASVTLADAKDSLYNVDVLFDTIVETNIPTVSTEE